MTCQLDGEYNPLEGTQGKYPKAISLLLKKYDRKDPPPKAQLAVTVSVPNTMYYQNMNGRENHKGVGDFGLIAFYYLLRIGEYTYHNKKERRQTKQFRLQDVTLWENTNILDPDLPLATLYKRCTAATLNIANQKNGV